MSKSHIPNPKSKITFKLDGQPLSLDTTPPLIRRIMAHLDALPDGDLESRLTLAEAIGSSEGSLGVHGRHSTLSGYTTIYRGKSYYGNPRAIAAFIKATQGAE